MTTTAPASRTQMTPSEIAALVTMEAGMVEVRAGDTPPIDRWYVDHLGVRRYTSARGWSASYAPSGLVVWPYGSTTFRNLFAAASSARYVVEEWRKGESSDAWGVPTPVASGKFEDYEIMNASGDFSPIRLQKRTEPEKPSETKGTLHYDEATLQDLLEKDVMFLSADVNRPVNNWYAKSSNSHWTRVYESSAGWQVEYNRFGTVSWSGPGWPSGPDSARLGGLLEAAVAARKIVQSRLKRDEEGRELADLEKNVVIIGECQIGTPHQWFRRQSRGRSGEDRIYSGGNQSGWSVSYSGCTVTVLSRGNLSDTTHASPLAAAKAARKAVADLIEKEREGQREREAKELAEMEKDYPRLNLDSKTTPVGQWYINHRGLRYFDSGNGWSTAYSGADVREPGAYNWIVRPSPLAAAKYARALVAERLEKDRADQEARELAELEKDVVFRSWEEHGANILQDQWTRSTVDALTDKRRRFFTTTAEGFTRQVIYSPNDSGTGAFVRVNNSPPDQYASLLGAAKAAREAVAKIQAEEAAKKKYPTHLEVGQVWRCDKTGSKRTVVETNRQDRFVVGIGSERATLVVDPDTLRITKVDGLIYLGRMAFTPADKE